MEGAGLMEMKCYCWGDVLYLVLTGGRRNEGLESRVIAVGSKAAAEEAAGGSRGRAVQQGELLGSLPVLELPDRASSCTGCKHRDCSRSASGRTCVDTTTKKTNMRVIFRFQASVEWLNSLCVIAL